MIDKQVFLAEIEILMDWFNREFEEATLNRLHERLSQHLSTSEFKDAALLVFDTARFFPTVEDFVTAAKGDADTLARQEWELCVKAAARADSSVKTQLTPAGVESLKLVGGISKLGQLDEDRLNWTKKEFVSIWKAWKQPQGPALSPATDNSLTIGNDAVNDKMRSLSKKFDLR